MIIDCDSCVLRARACGDCVVTVLLGGPPQGVELVDEDRQALAVLADSGLVPPLRLAVVSGSDAGVIPGGPEQDRAAAVRRAG